MNIVGNGILKAIARAFSQFNAFIVLKIEDAKVLEGISWSLRKRIDFTSDQTIDFVFDPTAAPAANKLVVCQPIAFDAIGGPFDVTVFKKAAANNNGTEHKFSNRDFSITGDAVSKFRQAPTGIVTDDAKPFELLIPSNGTGAVGVNGASGGDSIVSKPDPTTKIVIRIHNTDDTASARIGIQIDHFEVPQ